MPKVLLLILDGWGMKGSTHPLFRFGTHTTLKASGPAVGLPEGSMGNSEVGHLALGAGRIIPSDLVRINQSIKDGSFYKNKVLLNAFEQAKKKRQKLHLLGLLSDSGVHAHIDHLFALLELAKKMRIPEVYIHAILDGRDTPPKSARKYLQQLQTKINQLGVGTIATLLGRYYAMDRDNRWNREHQVYDCMVNCRGRKIGDPFKALQYAYDHGETDEFVKPTIITNKCVVDAHDSVIFFNFRSDRARELTRAFVDGRFHKFQRRKIIDLHFVCLTQYDSAIAAPAAFPPIVPGHTLGEVISQAGLSQLRLAETEKWAHVTYFFNGLCECIFPREHRIHIRSKLVKTYDKTPTMKARQITDSLLQNLQHEFFVVNLANGDMVGHTGNHPAIKKAQKAMIEQIERIIQKFPGVIIITSDHGNCEQKSGIWQTSHTLNAVPLVLVNYPGTLQGGGLSDVAPTILDILKIRKAKEMGGRSLLKA